MAFSSKWDENAPLAALEAMTAGRPLLVTRTGGLTELVDEGGGQIVEVGDVEATARAIKGLIEDDDLCRTLGERALAHALSEFAPALHRARLEAVYERALALASKPARNPLEIMAAIAPEAGRRARMHPWRVEGDSPEGHRSPLDRHGPLLLP